MIPATTRQRLPASIKLRRAAPAWCELQRAMKTRSRSPSITRSRRSDGVGLLDHDGSVITPVKFSSPQDYRIFTVDRNDRVEAILGLDTATNLAHYTNRPIIVKAGDGFDRVYGGDANDVLFAGEDRDEAGQSGFNLLVGRSGDDRLEGGDASDLLWGDDYSGAIETFAQSILVEGLFDLPRNLRGLQRQ